MARLGRYIRRSAPTSVTIGTSVVGASVSKMHSSRRQRRASGCLNHNQATNTHDTINAAAYGRTSDRLQRRDIAVVEHEIRRPDRAA